MPDIARDFNHSRYRPGATRGFYESFFQRANHPSRPQAFWIRYTLFQPADSARRPLGELWAVWFDGEAGRHVVAKSEAPLDQCEFAPDRFAVRVQDSSLGPGTMKGAAQGAGHRIEWDLAYGGGGGPLFLMPPAMYQAGFPKAKSLVGVPNAEFSGRVVVDGKAIDISGWRGSQNHNWGSRHTDAYAYGQVAGFDNAPDSFLELATGRLRLAGPLWSPAMTPMVLRHEGEEFAFNTLLQSTWRARGRYDFFRWTFDSHRDGTRIAGVIEAPREAFVGLRYYNPPGGDKFCLNSKIATCRLSLQRAGHPQIMLEARQRAAFEILTDTLAHGVEIRT